MTTFESDHGDPGRPWKDQKELRLWVFWPFGGSPGLVKGPYIGRFSRDNLNFEKKLKIQNNFKLPLK